MLGRNLAIVSSKPGKKCKPPVPVFSKKAEFQTRRLVLRGVKFLRVSIWGKPTNETSLGQTPICPDENPCFETGESTMTNTELFCRDVGLPLYEVVDRPNFAMLVRCLWNGN